MTDRRRNDMKQSVILSGLRFFARHGVDPQETMVGATFVLDLRLTTDFTRAMASDDLEGTVDYGAVFHAVRDEMDTPSRLLEHVAGRIARRILTDFPRVSAVSMELLKQNPPMGADCVGAGVALSVERTELDALPEISSSSHCP